MSSFSEIKLSFRSEVAKIVLTMSLATGSENEGYKRAKENRPTVDCACGDGIETTLFTVVCGWQAASNELDEAEDEEQEDIGNNEHGEAMIN